MVRFSGIALVIALLLAPIAAAFGGTCLCAHQEFEAEEIAPIPCCAEMHHCCLDHSQGHQAFPVVTDLSQQFRLEVGGFTMKIVGLVPACGSLARPKHLLVHGADPPGAVDALGQLSFRQIWLI